jgi:hypothetical protein
VTPSPPPPPDETAEWIRFGITTLLGVPFSVLGLWLLTEKRRERRRDRSLSIRDLGPPTSPPDLYLAPATGTADLYLETSSDLGTRAAMDQMAEVFPYEFPAT